MSLSAHSPCLLFLSSFASDCLTSLSPQVYDYPLAMCESGTVDVENDLEPTTLVYPAPAPNGETYSVKHNEKQVCVEKKIRKRRGGKKKKVEILMQFFIRCGGTGVK
jgi:hypothetical protein